MTIKEEKYNLKVDLANKFIKKRQRNLFMSIGALFYLSISLHKNLTVLTEQFNDSSNLKIRKLNVQDSIKKEAAIIY
ncbi:hypothetical protein V7161_18110 [Neobacillus drentensis]